MTPRLFVTVGLVILGALMVGVAQITGGNGAKPHPLGTEVVVGQLGTQIGLTVLAVRTGTLQQLEAGGIRLPDEAEGATPYYIEARFTNKGPNPVERNLHVGLEDSDGDLVRSPIIFGLGTQTYEPCPDITRGTLQPGESYEGCTLILGPSGTEVEKVYFLSDKGAGEPSEFVYWAAE